MSSLCQMNGGVATQSSSYIRSLAEHNHLHSPPTYDSSPRHSTFSSAIMSGDSFRMSPYKPTQSGFRMLAYNATESNGNITVHPPWNFVDEQALPSQRPELCSLLGISDQGVAEGSSHIHYTPPGSDDNDWGTVRIDGAGQPVSFRVFKYLPHDQVGFRSTGQSSQVMIWGTAAVPNGSTSEYPAIPEE